MRKFLVAVLVLCTLCSVGQNNLSGSRQGSLYTYVYKISAGEARQLQKKKLKNVSEAYLHTLVDSFRLQAPTLPPANYLFAKAVANRLQVDLRAVGDVSYKIINNNRDLVIALHTKEGRLLTDAKVSVGGRRLRYDAGTQTYRRNKAKRDGVLHVERAGTLYTFLVEQPRRYRRPFFQRVMLPFRQLFRKKRRTRYNDFHYGTAHEQGFKGFLVCSQPKYKPGDTVRLKAFVTNKKGAPLAERLLLRLSNRYLDVDSILGVISPYRPGGYDFSFVLNDSLDLDLDDNYLLTLEEEGSQEYNLRTYEGDLDEEAYAAKRLVVMRGRFQYEEYELDAITFSARSEKDVHSRGEETAVYLKAADENGLAVLDGRVQLTVRAQPYSAKTFSAPAVFLPDTLWQHEQLLDAVGETKIILPDSLFPKAHFSYWIECVFLNSNNERQTQTLRHAFRDHPERVLFEQQNDSLRIERLVSGKPQPVAATLYSFTGDDDTLSAQPVQLPLTVRVNPFANRVKLKTATLEDEYEIKAESLVSAQAARTKDSVFIRLFNPQRLPVWYTVFAGDKVVLRGQGDSLFYAQKTTTPQNYFFSIQYIFNNEVQNHDYTVPYRDKLLSVKFTQAAAVYPGQTAAVSVEVKDAEGAPVADADVTAWSYTRKFPDAAAPALPYFGKLYPGRKRYASFRPGEEENFSTSLKLTWQRWSREMGLDTIEYYKFLHPKSVYVNTEPAPDSLTQLAPFVVQNGEVAPVHQLFIDERPVFFSTSQNLQRYSFAVAPGRHSLRFRTHNNTIWLDSVEVKKGVKTFISINADVSNTRIRLQTAAPQLTAYERSLWSRYTILLQNNFGQNMAYINSGSQLFRLPQGYDHPHWVGPLPNGYGELVVKGKFSQPFEAEGGYHYFISKGLIKQKQLPPSVTILPLSAQPPNINFGDAVLTEKEVDRLWQDFLYRRSASEELFTNPYLMQTGNGALQIELPRDSTGKEPFIRHLFLFGYTDPDYLRVYAGARRDLGYVQPGTYRLVFLLKDDAYFIADSIRIKKDGLNFYRITPGAIKQRDSVSRRISAIVHEKERALYGYRDEDFSRIKQSFNRQYFDASNLTGTVSGVVTDEKGSPLAGVVVALKGAAIATVTDASGRYYLKTVPNGTLVASSVGYGSQEVKIRNNTPANFKLSPIKGSLSEVVVSAYGGGKQKRSVTGSVSLLEGEALLSGRAAGITIRGYNSADGANAPLVIVNGVPYSGKLDDLDPATIATTNVLKGDAATALYGSQASGGAIIITTKTTGMPDAGTGELSAPTATLRQNFRDAAYWQPRLRTNADGKASFTVTFPDDITAWRSFALVMTDKQQSGFAEGLVRSFKTISGNLALPQFVITGDTVSAIGKSLHYGVDSIQARRQFFINGQLAKEGLLRFRHSWIDTFAVVAPAGDSLKLKYTLQKEDGYFDGEERRLPVFRPGVLQTDGFFAALRRDTTLTLQPLSDTGTIKIYAEASVLPVLEKEVENLRRYEYLCNEQLASKLKGLLVQKRIDSFLKRPFRYDKYVRELVSKLSQNKTGAGLWGWWNEGSPTLWISLHAAEALLQASAQGYTVSVNKQVLTDYLVFHLESYRGTEKLSALHLLQLLGAKADFRRYTDSLQKDLWKMSLSEKLRLAAIKQEAGLPYSLDSVIANQSRTMFGNLYWGEEGYRFFDNSIQNTLLMYRLLKKAGGHEDLLEKARGYLLEKRRTGHWRNTYESSLILETILPDVLVNDSLPQMARLHLAGGVHQTVTGFPFATEVKSGEAITVRKEGGLPVYFTAYQQRWNAAPEKVNGDFTVRTWFEKNGNTIAQLKAGEPVVMKIAVSVKADASYVMVEAPIPAGCSYHEKRQSYANNEVHREHFKNKVSIFCSRLPKGDYMFTVALLPRYSGRYTLNPAKAEMMYFPVFYGREEMKKVRID